MGGKVVLVLCTRAGSASSLPRGNRVPVKVFCSRRPTMFGSLMSVSVSQLTRKVSVSQSTDSSWSGVRRQIVQNEAIRSFRSARSSRIDSSSARLSSIKSRATTKGRMSSTGSQMVQDKPGPS